jgi:hypothetical protein
LRLFASLRGDFASFRGIVRLGGRQTAAMCRKDGVPGGRTSPRILWLRPLCDLFASHCGSFSFVSRNIRKKSRKETRIRRNTSSLSRKETQFGRHSTRMSRKSPLFSREAAPDRRKVAQIRRDLSSMRLNVTQFSRN